jgi:integrase
VTIDRGAGDAQRLGDLSGALAAIAPGPRSGELVGVHHSRAPADVALSPRCGQPGHHLEHAPLSGHTPRTYLGAVRAYLVWLGQAPVDGDPLNDVAAKDWAVRDYRSYLVTVAKRATATVNKHLAALQDFYVWRGLGQPQGVKRHQVPRHAPKALEPRAKLRYLRAVEAWPSARDRALALLPLYAGTRIAEIHALDVADARLSARKGELHLVGKGEKSRTVPVHQKLREALAAWLAERPSKPDADSAALFTALGRRLRPSGERRLRHGPDYPPCRVVLVAPRRGRKPRVVSGPAIGTGRRTSRTTPTCT